MVLVVGCDGDRSESALEAPPSRHEREAADAPADDEAAPSPPAAQAEPTTGQVEAEPSALAPPGTPPEACVVSEDVEIGPYPLPRGGALVVGKGPNGFLVAWSRDEDTVMLRRVGSDGGLAPIRELSMHAARVLEGAYWVDGHWVLHAADRRAGYGDRESVYQLLDADGAAIGGALTLPVYGTSTLHHAATRDALYRSNRFVRRERSRGEVGRLVVGPGAVHYETLEVEGCPLAMAADEERAVVLLATCAQWESEPQEGYEVTFWRSDGERPTVYRGGLAQRGQSAFVSTFWETRAALAGESIFLAHRPLDEEDWRARRTDLDGRVLDADHPLETAEGPPGGSFVIRGHARPLRRLDALGREVAEGWTLPRLMLEKDVAGDDRDALVVFVREAPGEHGVVGRRVTCPPLD